MTPSESIIPSAASPKVSVEQLGTLPKWTGLEAIGLEGKHQRALAVADWKVELNLDTYLPDERGSYHLPALCQKRGFQTVIGDGYLVVTNGDKRECHVMTGKRVPEDRDSLRRDILNAVFSPAVTSLIALDLDDARRILSEKIEGVSNPDKFPDCELSYHVKHSADPTKVFAVALDGRPKAARSNVDIDALVAFHGIEVLDLPILPGNRAFLKSLESPDNALAYISSLARFERIARADGSTRLLVGPLSCPDSELRMVGDLSTDGYSSAFRPIVQRTSLAAVLSKFPDLLLSVQPTAEFEEVKAVHGRSAKLLDGMVTFPGGLSVPMTECVKIDLAIDQLTRKGHDGLLLSKGLGIITGERPRFRGAGGNDLPLAILEPGILPTGLAAGFGMLTISKQQFFVNIPAGSSGQVLLIFSDNSTAKLCGVTITRDPKGEISFEPYLPPSGFCTIVTDGGVNDVVVIKRRGMSLRE